MKLAIALTIVARGGDLAAIAPITLLLAWTSLVLLPMVVCLTGCRR